MPSTNGGNGIVLETVVGVASVAAVLLLFAGVVPILVYVSVKVATRAYLETRRRFRIESRRAREDEHGRSS